MILIYDYSTGKFIRNQSNGEFIEAYNEAPRWLKHNKRWVDLDNLSVIDIAYIYVENEYAKSEGLPLIELGEKYEDCIDAKGITCFG